MVFPVAGILDSPLQPSEREASANPEASDEAFSGVTGGKRAATGGDGFVDSLPVS